MTDFNKTAKLRLREPTERKKEILYKVMDQVVEAANRTAVRLPSISIPQLKNKRGGDSLVTKWVKEFRGDGIDLPYNYTQLAVEQAFTNYLNNLEERVKKLEGKWGERFRQCEKEFKLKVAKRYQKVPEFKNRSLPIRGKDIRGIHEPGEEENEGNYYGLVFYPIPRKQMGIPFSPGAYQDFFLERLIDGRLSFADGVLVKYENYWSFNLHVQKETDVSYKPQTFIGVDVGLNVLAWAVAIDKNDSFLDEVHFKGGEAGHIRDRYNRKRKNLKKTGNIQKVEELHNRESRWIENKNHTLSSQIITFASQFEKPLILLENINAEQLREKTDNPKIHSWPVGKLQTMITYKAEEHGIKVEEVNPAYTSQKCPKCGHTDENNRNGVHFTCQECGYTNHSDFVGSRNIAGRE